MGAAPPPDGPPLAAQDQSAEAAGFKQDGSAVDLCGFKLPFFIFKFPALPSLPGFPPALPIPRISLGLNCSTDNPVDVTAGVAYGGGRVAKFDPDQDLALDEATS
jgi:hypothetical protein